MPAVRKILADTAPEGYRIQSIILGIVQSYPFRYRRLDDALQQATTSASRH
jgi:hypothetical protein